MRILTTTLLALTVISGSVQAAAPPATYGIHLFFDEREFVDVLTLEKDEADNLKGHMDVPNDFAGDVTNLKLQGDSLQFDLFVPKNSARPQDLIFHYEAKFFDTTHRQLAGFVTLKGQKSFVASFVGFLRGGER
ncbi:MAG: hypothetical protein NDJ89_03520 [Oligoflexia bacterium]|nr:hypothetical protein [Oligoflexia bacterium]